jgi:hypothetical protein
MNYLTLFANIVLSQLYIVISDADIIMNMYDDHNDLIYCQIPYGHFKAV